MAKLTGTVAQIIFRNSENGYTVLELESENEYDTVTGNFPLIREGDFVTLEGEFFDHDSYGMQFRATNYEISVPETAEDIEMYLASGIISGIGPKLAKTLVDEFGKHTLEIIEKEPERLLRVGGIGKKKLAGIIESYKECIGARNTVMALQHYGITPNMALKIYARYSDGTLNVLKENPYRLVNDIDGIGFNTADAIAAKLGIERESYFRICASVQYCLKEAGSDGHTYLPEDILVERVSELIGIAGTKIKESLTSLSTDLNIVIRDVEGVKAIYHPSFFYAEAIVAGNLLKLQNSVATEKEESIEKEIAAYEKENGIELAQKQKQAVVQAINNGICVITGGPGTGKTTTLACILQLFRKRGIEIALAAPTGRAAKRMAAATGTDAKTIHRMLEYTKTEDGYLFKRNKDNPVECGVCIVDEASMIDIFLMQSLLEGLKGGTRLILVGDVDQLPSVGAGNVLEDIIKSGAFPVVALTEIFRQAGESMIITNAHKINSGELPIVNTKDTDFFLDRRTDDNAICSAIVELCLKRLPQKYGISPIKDIQVLTPIKKSPCGVFNLNKVLQQALNPRTRDKHEHAVGEDIFREGDKVIQIRNNYDRAWTTLSEHGVITKGTGMFNGDTGIITSIYPDERKITVEYDDGKLCDYEFHELDELSLAYAMSVHKSQGCEFPFVVMAVPCIMSRVMTRNLFYTAVTRAKKIVVLCGSQGSMAGMIRNVETKKRYSALDTRLKIGKSLL